MVSICKSANTAIPEFQPAAFKKLLPPECTWKRSRYKFGQICLVAHEAFIALYLYSKGICRSILEARKECKFKLD